MANLSKIILPNNTAVNLKDANVPHSSLTAASSGTDLSLVTTGEKYTWNNKQNALTRPVTGASVWDTADRIVVTNANSGNVVKQSAYTIATSVPSGAVFTDTKNTAGSTDTSSKIFLIGATSQAANPQTYSQDTAYVGTDGCLYSGGSKVLTSHQDISGKVNRSGDTMTGALNFANATANKMGDDAQVGDHNRGGSFGIQGLNGPTTITLLKQGGTWGNTEGGSIQYNATTKSLDFLFT